MSEYGIHRSVMVREVLELLASERGGLYADGTVGGGGHAEAVLTAGSDARLIGVDRDPQALRAARERLSRFGDRVTLRSGNFADLGEVFGLGEGTLAGVLLDLGVSSHQIDSSERGFSFRPGVPLDMRMNPEEATLDAAGILNESSEEELVGIFREYGEERRGSRLAREVCRRRGKEPFRRSDDLARAVESVLGRRPTSSDLAPVFQALRIAVNRELESLERSLPRLRDLLVPGGRLVVIAYHSLEDRLVKRSFREWSRECVCPPGLPVCRCRGRPLGRELTRGPRRPTEEEIRGNPRSRSARLRAWERGE